MDLFGLACLPLLEDLSGRESRNFLEMKPSNAVSIHWTFPIGSRGISKFSLLSRKRWLMDCSMREILEENTGDRILDCWSDLVPYLEHTDELGGLQFIELRSTLPDELLLYADKLSMAHSLEVRVPYLDREIVEFVERLNSSYKVRYWKKKMVASPDL